VGQFLHCTNRLKEKSSHLEGTNSAKEGFSESGQVIFNEWGWLELQMWAGWLKEHLWEV